MAGSAPAPSSLASSLPLICLFQCKAITPELSTPTNPEVFCLCTSLGTELVEQEHSGGGKGVGTPGVLSLVPITLHFQEPGEVQGDWEGR